VIRFDKSTGGTDSSSARARCWVSQYCKFGTSITWYSKEFLQVT